MARQNFPAHSHIRDSIAQLAARLMAEGVDDFALAKRKAARQLGVPETQQLPNNGEVEQALRTYQALYRSGTQDGLLQQLRTQALEIMRELACFEPLLSGSVLRGTATPYSDINLFLFADSQKDVELHLLNRGINFKTSEKRLRFGDNWRSATVLLLSDSGAAAVRLTILSIGDRRCMPWCQIDGRAARGARLTEVQALLDGATPAV